MRLLLAASTLLLFALCWYLVPAGGEAIDAVHTVSREEAAVIEQTPGRAEQRTAVTPQTTRSAPAPEATTARVLRVVSAATGRPIQGAVLHMLGTETPGILAHTDVDGLATLELASRSYLRIEARGFAARVVGLGSEVSGPLTVSLHRSAELELLLEADLVVSQVRIRVSTEESFITAPGTLGTRMGRVTWEKTGSPHARYRLEDLAPGAPLRLELLIAGRPARRHGETLILKPGERRSITWKIGSGTLVHGRVLDDMDKPVSETTLWFKRAPKQSLETRLFFSYERSARRGVKTDQDGGFRFESVSPGLYWIGPAPVRGGGERLNTPAPLAHLVRVPVDTAEVEVLIRAPRGLVFAGKVKTPTGDAPERAYVRVTDLQRGGFVGANVRADGSFLIGPLAPGRYEILAERASRWAASLPRVVQPPIKDLQLDLRASGSLSCQVVLDEHIDVDSVTLILCPRSGGPMSSGLRVAKGLDFAWSNLAPGLYDVFASAVGPLTALRQSLRVTANQNCDGVELWLTRGASVRIESSRDQVMWFKLWCGEALVHEGALNPGLAVSRLVAPGSIRIECSVDGKLAAEAKLQVAAGESRKVNFD